MRALLYRCVTRWLLALPPLVRGIVLLALLGVFNLCLFQFGDLKSSWKEVFAAEVIIALPVAYLVLKSDEHE